MTNEEPLMNDEQAGEAVAKYLEDNPELLQGIAPARDLWPSIEARISARVMPISTRPVRVVRKPFGWVPMLVAASALIAASAGVTYVLTTRSVAGNGAASSVASVAAIKSSPRDTTAQGTSSAAERMNGEVPAARNDVPARDQDTSPAAVQSGRGSAQLASHPSPDEGDEMRRTYDSEIATLHAALEARRDRLNPSTVAIIEQNLRVIDDAISQSRAALARDPNSRLLNDQLDRTLAKKTGLLRVAALLPAA